MLVGFIGDVHGQVFHVLAAVAMWQIEAARKFDLLIQVGDLGAYPDPARMDAASRRYVEADPSRADFSRLLQSEFKTARYLQQVRQRYVSPIYFIRGNHEDSSWLRGLPVALTSTTAPVDPFDLFRFVPDGTVLRAGALRIAFLGGAEEDMGEGAIDPAALGVLMELGLGKVDLLVTHDAPYGISTGYYGQVQGSPMISRLVEKVQPTFHVAGHLALNGPRLYGQTRFLCLNGIIDSPLWKPSARGLETGCMATLDTDTGILAPVTAEWFHTFPTPLDFDPWFEGLGAIEGA